MKADFGTDPHPATAELAYLSREQLARQLDERKLRSAEITEALISRVEAIDHSGPALRSVIRLNARALDDAKALDAETDAGHRRGALHGIPVLVKDNIDTAGPMGTTAGSLALEGWSPAADASLVEHLRSAGAVIVGKTNLTEWANFRGRPSSSGWSAVGGQTLNPHALDRTPGGSSAGSGSAVAGGLAPLSIGTETDGSILCPAAACGIVGVKPTLGLVSRTGIVPVARSQDTAGPMARSVTDAAWLLTVLAAGEPDSEDEALATPSGRPSGGVPDYSSALSPDLRGRRIGAVREEGYVGYHGPTDALLELALSALVEAGAEVVDVPHVALHFHADEMTVLQAEFKSDLTSYLERRVRGREAAGLPTELHWTTVDELIEFIRKEPDERFDLFPVDVFEGAAVAPGLDDPEYLAAAARIRLQTRDQGIDLVCAAQQLDALVAPSMAPPWPIDHALGDTQKGASWSMAAVAGYPSINLPIGYVNGLPVGLAIWGQAWSEATLLHVAFGLEQQLGLSPMPAWLPSANLLAQLPPEGGPSRSA